MKYLYENGNKKAGLALKLSDNYSKSLTGILIGNNIVNIAASTIGTVIFTSLLGAYGAGVSTVVLTIVILIFGEVTPKSFAKDNANNLSMNFARILSFIIFIFTPFIFLFNKLKELISRFTKSEENPSFTEQELKVIIDEIEDEGVLEENEGELVRSALDLDETAVEEAMVPRVDVVSVELSTSHEKIKDIFIKKRFSNLPVYSKQIDNIIGILSEKDFFREYLNKEEFEIEKILIKPLFVPPQIKVSELLIKFREIKTHMAIIIDQYGGVDGIITLENVFEELVGDISEKQIEKQDDFEKVGNNKYIINPDITCNDLFEKLEYFPKNFETEANTVGGWILEMLKKMPKRGDSCTFDKLKATVLKVKGKRITSIKIEIIK